MKPITILLTGTTSSGKTTLIQELQRELQNVFATKISFIPEVAREILEINPQLLHEPAILQDKIFSAQTQAEQAAVANGSSIIVCDRGVLDILSHIPLLQPELTIKPEWISWLTHYTKTFICNPADISYQETELQSQLTAVHDWARFRDQLHQETLRVAQSYLDPQSIFDLKGDLYSRTIQVTEQIIWEWHRNKEGAQRHAERE